MIPTAELKLEIRPSLKPKPMGCHVIVDGKTIAVLTLDNVRAIAAQIAELEA